MQLDVIEASPFVDLALRGHVGQGRSGGMGGVIFDDAQLRAGVESQPDLGVGAQVFGPIRLCHVVTLW